MRNTAQYSGYSSYDKDTLFDTFDRFIAILVTRYFRWRDRSSTLPFGRAFRPAALESNANRDL